PVRGRSAPVGIRPRPGGAPPRRPARSAVPAPVRPAASAGAGHRRAAGAASGAPPRPPPPPEAALSPPPGAALASSAVAARPAGERVTFELGGSLPRRGR